MTDSDLTLISQPPKLSFCKKIRVLLRALRQFSGWYQRLLAEEVWRQMKWHGARILVPAGGGHFAIFTPVAEGDEQGMIQRTHRIFDHHTYAPYTQAENHMFIQAARGKKRFLDIGAAEGYYSALFSAIAGSDAEIISVDPMDPGWVGEGHLESVRTQNRKFHKNKRWEIVRAYLTDNTNAIDPAAQVESECEVMTLVQLCDKFDFRPDFIKLDIESWEWEVLLSSIDFLREIKPTIILELHGSILRDRGLSPSELVERIKSVAGYKVAFQEARSLENADNSHLVLQPVTAKTEPLSDAARSRHTTA